MYFQTLVSSMDLFSKDEGMKDRMSPSEKLWIFKMSKSVELCLTVGPVVHLLLLPKELPAGGHWKYRPLPRRLWYQ